MNNVIGNYFEYSEKISSGAQPSAEQIRMLKESGVEAIINISPVSTKNYLKEEAEITESLKMIYIHFPIDCSNLQLYHYPMFKGILDTFSGKKIFIHCGGNIKTSNLMHMYNVLEKNISEEESLQILKRIQTPESKWFDYFRKFGMIGLS